MSPGKRGDEIVRNINESPDDHDLKVLAARDLEQGVDDSNQPDPLAA